MLTLTQIMKVRRFMDQTGGISNCFVPPVHMLDYEPPAKRFVGSKRLKIRFIDVEDSRTGDFRIIHDVSFLEQFPPVSKNGEVYDEAEVELRDKRNYRGSVLGRQKNYLLMRAGNNRVLRFDVKDIAKYYILERN